LLHRDSHHHHVGRQSLRAGRRRRRDGFESGGEYEETRDKARALLRALEIAEQGL